jgi:integrase
LATLYVRTRKVGDGSRRYDVKYRRGGRYTPLEHGGTFATRREANERRTLIGDFLAGGLNPRLELRRRVEPGRPLRQAAEGWIASRRQVSERTREGYRWREPVILETFGATSPEEILVEDVIGWVGSLERRYKPGSIRLLVAQLRLMLDYCGGPNPARDRRVQLPRQERRQVSPPDADAVVFMLAELTEWHVATAIAMELLGTRVSETLSLERRDLQPGAVRVRSEASKSGRSRLVPAPDFLVDALMERLPLRGHRQSVANAMRRAGGINPHALRHRRASLWYQQGVGPVELAARLGHARPSMSLDVYSHVEPLQEIPHATLSAFFK